jgi:PAS domain S-box-containing protein
MAGASRGLVASRRALSRRDALVFAALAALLTGLLAWAFHEQFPRGGFLFLYVPVIGAVAYIGDRSAGLIAVGAGLLSALIFIMPPVYSFAVVVQTLPILVVFALIGVLAVEWAVRLRAAEIASYRFMLLVESSDDAILSKSLDGIIQTWNPGAERLYGYTAAEAIGRPIAMLVPPDHPNEMPELMARLRRGERIEHYETIRLRKDGTPITVAISLSPVVDPGGRIIAASVIARDVTARRQAEERVRAQADLLDLSYDAIFVWELGGGITYWNREAEALYGFSREEAVGRVSHKLLRTTHPGGLGNLIDALTRTGRWEGELRRLTKDGREIVVDSRNRLIERDGQRLVLETNRDVTERRRAERRQQSLGAVTAALSEALTPEDVADAILAHGLGALDAQAGMVYVMSADGAALETLRQVGYPDDLVRQRGTAPISAPMPVVEAIKTGEAIYADAADHVLARYPALRDRMHPHPGARVYVPMAVSGRTVGALAFVFRAVRSFDGADREFIQALAVQCAQALERARLYAREHHVAARLQRALLPATFPDVPGVRIAAVYRAARPEAEVGGDWYDAFTLPGGRLVLTIGDVAGRGLDAAVLMGEMRHAMRTAALAGHDPAKVLQVANSVLGASGRAMVTAAVVFVDPITWQCLYATAGHPPPLVATHRGIEKLDQVTIPLGFREGLPIAAESLRLPPQALLVLYTDGLIEFDRDPISGELALHAAVVEVFARRLSNPAQAILEQVLASRPALDDIAILTVAVDVEVAR